MATADITVLFLRAHAQYCALRSEQSVKKDYVRSIFLKSHYSESSQADEVSFKYN